MYKNVRFAVAAAIGVVLIGASYVSWSSVPPRIDAFAITMAAKNLPSEQFDAHESTHIQDRLPVLEGSAAFFSG